MLRGFCCAVFHGNLDKVLTSLRLSLVRVGRKKKKRAHEQGSESKLDIIDATVPQEQEEEEELQVLTGTGRISTSGGCFCECLAHAGREMGGLTIAGVGGFYCWCDPCRFGGHWPRHKVHARA